MCYVGTTGTQIHQLLDDNLQSKHRLFPVMSSYYMAVGWCVLEHECLNTSQAVLEPLLKTRIGLPTLSDCMLCEIVPNT